MAEVEEEGYLISHYFNFTEDVEIDVIRSQFKEGTVIPKEIIKKGNYRTVRDKLLSSEFTRNRYLLLKLLSEKYS